MELIFQALMLQLIHLTEQTTRAYRYSVGEAIIHHLCGGDTSQWGRRDVTGVTFAAFYRSNIKAIEKIKLKEQTLRDAVRLYIMCQTLPAGTEGLTYTHLMGILHIRDIHIRNRLALRAAQENWSIVRLCTEAAQLAGRRLYVRRRARPGIAHRTDGMSSVAGTPAPVCPHCYTVYDGDESLEAVNGQDCWVTCNNEQCSNEFQVFSQVQTLYTTYRG